MSLSGFDIVLASIGLSLSFYLYYTKALKVRVPKGLQLPPGPPRHPIWGNLKDLPAGTLQYRVYEKWAKKYGDLVYFNILGQSMLLINSAEIQRELFMKRGLIYSDRQKTTMMHDLTDFGKSTLITMNYGEQWTRHRAIIHDLVSAKRILSYRPLLETTARTFARRVIAERVTDLNLTRDVFGEFIMQIVYGIDTLPENDPYVKLAERTVHDITGVLVPGAYMVDIFPIMKYLPSWFPGLKFPKAAEELNKNFRAMLSLPYEYAKTAFKRGNFKPSFVSDYLEDLANSPNSPKDAEEVIRKIAVTLYIAGIDTLETQIRLFALAMALHPEIQKKAQEELDRVIGKDSLPTFADLPNLPYVNALCSESLRWPVMVPLALPHQLKQDDIVNGYFIPKGTICMGNTWLLLRSEQEYGPDTHKFRPERFLDGSAKQKPDIAFGYGRRVCPGKALAETVLNIMIATTLHVANISMLEDEPLADIIENHDFSPGAVARPRDFRCQIEARPGAQDVLNQFTSH